ncbi:MAG TPA: substrate-binding domain-containing protein [Xanthobacteraceae bacterium]|nr:substrate-binding domain-containing protein [Xanthobacteraceae bacterium]
MAGLALVGALLAGGATQAEAAPDLKIALIYSKTGPLEAYAKQTETGLMLGLEFLTGGTMTLDGRKIVVLPKDDQGKPDLAKSLLEQAYADDKVDLAIGATSSGATLAMLPVAEDAGKVLIVEPAVADSITGEKWNRFIFRTARNSTQDAIAGAVALGGAEVAVGTLAQDYAFGRDGVAALKEALVATRSKAKVVFEEYAPMGTTDFTASAQRLFDALKDRPGRKVIAILWAGPHPLAKIAALKPERYGIELAPGGNILPVMMQFRQFAGIEGTIYYYYGFPKNPMNDWLVAEHQKRFGSPPDFFTAGGMAAASATVTAIRKAGGTDAEKLIPAMEGLAFDTPKGKMMFRKEDHQALQAMYHFRIKSDGKDPYDLLDLVREIPIAELPVPIRNKR